MRAPVSVDAPPTPWPERRVAPGLAMAAGVLVWPAAAALLLSLQFLFQPWVWVNWPVSDVLWAWLFVLRDRLVIALAITLLLAAAAQLPVRELRWRAPALALAVALGALLGEGLLRGADDRPRADLGGVAARWSIVAMAVAALYALWRHAADVGARMQAEQLEQVRAQQRRASAQLSALRHQIEPHFLFNTLATVRRLHRTEPHEGAALLANFIEYLRRSLPILDRSQVPMEEELTLLRAYLAVVVVRMSGRLRTEFDVPEALLRVPVPPLVLATLVENAIRHGISPSPEGGLIRLAARAVGDRVEIVVEDTGVGLGGANSGGTGIGLSNARTRLRALHGAAASLTLQNMQPRGVRAILSLPARPARAGP